MGYGWKWWVTTYFKVMFSQEIWFSWYFLILESLMVVGLFDPPRPVITQALMCIGFLLALAAVYTTAGMLDCLLRLRIKKRVEEETALRMAFAKEAIQSAIQATPPPVEKNPWFLGGWTKHLDDK